MRRFTCSLKVLVLVLTGVLEVYFGYGAHLNYSNGNYFWAGYDIMIMLVQIPLLIFLLFTGIWLVKYPID